MPWTTTTGQGSVHTFTIAHRPPHPIFADQLPLVVAVVELDDGPRLTTNIVECDTADVEIGMPVEVTFLHVDDVMLPVFRPRPRDQR